MAFLFLEFDESHVFIGEHKLFSDSVQKLVRA